MLWIKENGAKMVLAPATSIRWGDITLKPTSADVSPEGDRVVVAAELNKPQLYERTECILSAMIFLWDGKNNEVKPLFEPSLNGLPRYKFTETGEPWAHIVGDVKTTGLENVIDPAYVMQIK